MPSLKAQGHHDAEPDAEQYDGGGLRGRGPEGPERLIRENILASHRALSRPAVQRYERNHIRKRESIMSVKSVHSEISRCGCISKTHVHSAKDTQWVNRG